MENRNTTVSRTSLIISFLVIYSIMPILSRLISMYLTTYAYMLLVVLVTLKILLSGGMKQFNECISALLPFAFYQLYTYFCNSDSLILWGYRVLLFLLPVLVGYYITTYRRDSLKTVGIVVFFAVTITVVTTVVGLIQYPYAARILATDILKDDFLIITYSLHNIGGYSFVYTVVLLYPVAIFAYKQKRINKIVLIAVAVAVFFMIILSEYTIALLFFLASSLLLFAGKKLNSKQMLLAGIGFVIFIALFQTAFSHFFVWLADHLDSETVSARLLALAGGQSGLEASDDNRLPLYMASITCFLQNPFFGTMFRYYSGGGHSFLLDSLSNYGVLGGITIFLMYRTVYRLFLKPYQKQEGFGYIIWIFAQAIILSLVNTGMWLNVLALYVPTLLHLIYARKEAEGLENSLDCEHTA